MSRPPEPGPAARGQAEKRELLAQRLVLARPSVQWRVVGQLLAELAGPVRLAAALDAAERAQ